MAMRSSPWQLGSGRASQGYGLRRHRRRDLLLRLWHVSFSHPDDEFQRDAHRAYNDWASDYASYAPRRLFPIANISMTDPAEDLKEVHRIKKMGFRGIFVSNDPLPERRYDNPMWEEFWTVVEEYDLPVNVHILTRQGGPQVGPNPIVDGVVLPVPAFRTIAEMIMGTVLQRHPNLKLISVENDIGWIPNYLKRLEWYSMLSPRASPSSRGTRPTTGAARCTPPSRTMCPACAAAI